MERESPDPAVLGWKDKHYIVGPKYRAARPPSTYKANDAAEIQVEIADDLPAALSNGVLQSATLRMMIEQFTSSIINRAA